MKCRIWICAVLILGITLILSASCKKDEETPSGEIKDRDGNVYHTVTIGTQVWMVENLKTTKYNDGTSIPLVRDGSKWTELSTPGYCWLNNEAANKDIYGALYNFYTVNTGKLCPKGWHVPTDAEWTILTDYLGGEEIAGGKLKEAGTAHWSEPNTGATNETGFTALPGGYRSDDGNFFEVGMYLGSWWSSTESVTNLAWIKVVGYYNDDINRNNYSKQYGFSVRCLRD